KQTLVCSVTLVLLSLFRGDIAFAFITRSRRQKFQAHTFRQDEGRAVAVFSVDMVVVIARVGHDIKSTSTREWVDDKARRGGTGGGATACCGDDGTCGGRRGS